MCVSDNYSEELPLSFSVPQGSASGANIFVCYCASLIKELPESVVLQGFADNHFIRNAFPAGSRELETKALNELERSIAITKTWMDRMRLKLNSDKTEFILIGNQIQLNKVATRSLQVNDQTIECAPSARCLGAWIDKNLNFKLHVKKKAQIAMFNLKRIRQIRKFLTSDACETLMLTLVMSHLDYCNSILLGVPAITIKPFQRIQNLAGKIILRRSKRESATQTLRDLNWLPIK